MKHKKESLVLGRILKKIAPRIGATVCIDPTWEIVGQITFKNGKRSYFRYNTLDLNPMGSSEIAKDKDYANFFMKSMGYPIIPDSKVFFSQQWADAIGVPKQNIDAAFEYASTLGLPVIVKPNSGSQGSKVELVHTRKGFYKALRAIFKSDRVALVQRYITGNDYRLVVLDKEVVSAYQRIPLNVIGDGKSTIAQLLQKKQKKFIATSRDTQIKNDDPRIIHKLQQQKLSMTSIAGKKVRVFLLDNANLSTGGDSVDVTKNVHPEFKKLAIKLTRDMGLRLCGVDLMIAGTIQDKPKDYWILEINSAPGLDHYAKIGIEQEKIVEDLYLNVLTHLEK